MADLAAALDVTACNLTTLVDGLEREGVVRRRPHPTDRRATLIELCDSAFDAVDESMDHQAAIGDLFESLAAADRAPRPFSARFRAMHQPPAAARGSRRAPASAH